ncbi:MAG: DUF58 domain-containing protein [Tissierellaceae bacterium]|nr:DUF58 domain-containing protein [Tissierellaceae bacterium]
MQKASLYSGDSLTIEYTILNNGFLPISSIEIQNRILEDLANDTFPATFISLGKKQSYTAKETVVLRRRGYYEMGNIHIIIRDVFGLFSIKKTISSQISLLVYPKVIKFPSFSISISQQLGELLIPNSNFYDQSMVSNLREYRYGDPIRAVHWKLSAKIDSTMVKEYENRGDAKIEVFIDNERTLFKNDVDRRLEDKIVEIATALINFCLEYNIQVQLKTQNNNKLVAVEGQQKSDFRPFLKSLAKFKGNGKFDFETFYSFQFTSPDKGATIAIITTTLNKSIGTKGLELKMKNLNPLLVVVTDKENNMGFVDSNIEDNLRTEGILVYILDYNENLENLVINYG